MATRRDPSGNALPSRLRFKHGSYHYVVDHKWSVLSRDYAEALREWAKREGAGKRAQTFAQAAEAWLTERGHHAERQSTGVITRRVYRVFEKIKPVG